MEILDRLSGISILKERLAETSRHVDNSLNWLLDHEKRLIHLEAAAKLTLAEAPRRLPRK